jgi:hypothetical protein
MAAENLTGGMALARFSLLSGLRSASLTSLTWPSGCAHFGRDFSPAHFSIGSKIGPPVALTSQPRAPIRSRIMKRHASSFAAKHRDARSLGPLGGTPRLLFAFMADGIRGRLRCRWLRRPRSLGHRRGHGRIAPFRSRHSRRHDCLLDLSRIANRTADEPALDLTVVGRRVRKPALECVPLVARQSVADHRVVGHPEARNLRAGRGDFGRINQQFASLARA